MKKQLANGLVLRTLSEGFASDRENLPQFYADVNGEGSSPENKDRIKYWVNDLMGAHPTTTPDDIFIVVDPAQHDTIASAALLIPQTWRYEGVHVSVGRPELCGTNPDYRRRGLMRELFTVMHERSAALGNQMQVITGIAHFYRQFGYTMAVDMGSDHATFPLGALTDRAPDYTPAFTLRPATTDDIPKLAEWYDYMARERLLTEYRDDAQWRYEIAGYHADSIRAMDYQIIVNAAGEGVGYLELYANRMEKHIAELASYVVGDQSSYLETFDDVMHGIKVWTIARYGECPALLTVGAGIHEALDCLIQRTQGGSVQALDYPWYVRVPEMISFLRHIQPALERRLEDSGAHRYTGELKIGFYDLTGIGLKFERGRVTEITHLQGKDGYDVSFPWHLFWNVLFGHHRADEVRAILPEVEPNAKAAVLLDVLFPKKKSWLKGLS